MNLQTIIEFLPKRKPIPAHTIVTMYSTEALPLGSLLTFHTYDQSTLAQLLKWACNITPPTNHTTLRVSRIIGKSQLELEQVEC